MNSLPEKFVDSTVWMTDSGYPAIIKTVDSLIIHGLVVSPSGTINCSWSGTGENLIKEPNFFNLKYPPEQISHKYAIIENKAFIALAPDREDAVKAATLNNADLFCKYSDLIKYAHNLE